jgi:hypothetical protein
VRQPPCLISGFRARCAWIEARLQPGDAERPIRLIWQAGARGSRHIKAPESAAIETRVQAATAELREQGAAGVAELWGWPNGAAAAQHMPVPPTAREWRQVNLRAWRAGRAAYRGEEYAAVEVVHPAATDKTAPASVPAVAPPVPAEPVPEPKRRAENQLPRGPGRPSRRPDILVSFRVLRDENKLDPKSMTRNYTPLRKHVVDMTNDPEGLGNEAIRLTIREEFNTWKSTCKLARKSAKEL